MFENVEAFYRPGSIREALRLLHNGGSRARFVAGGTDVIAQGDRSVRLLVDVTQLRLSYIRRKGNSRTIGATSTLAELEESPAIRTLAHGILAQACSACGPVQLRNRATVGGELAKASPAADLATPLLALDAVVILAKNGGRRKIPLADFFSGSGETALGKGLLVEVIIPPAPSGRRAAWSFQRLGRTESDLSLVSVAAGLQWGPRGAIQRARIAVGAAEPRPARALEAERLLLGKKLDPSLLAQVCGQVALEVNPIADIRASAEYRREMCRVLAGRALRECAARTGCSL